MSRQENIGPCECCGGEPPIETECCPDNPTQADLTLTITSVDCPEFAGTWPLTYSADVFGGGSGIAGWTSGSVTVGGYSPRWWVFACISGGWQLNLYVNSSVQCGIAFSGETADDCDPLTVNVITQMVNLSAGCSISPCASIDNITIVITE